MALSWILNRSYRTLLTIAATAVLSVPCYLLVPACGPRYAYPYWPFTDECVMVATGARNCFPSLHFAWALILALDAPGRWRYLYWPWAILTGLATVVGGEHYVVDVLVALPFTALVVMATRVSYGSALPERQKSQIGPSEPKEAV